MQFKGQDYKIMDIITKQELSNVESVDTKALQIQFKSNNVIFTYELQVAEFDSLKKEIRVALPQWTYEILGYQSH